MPINPSAPFMQRNSAGGTVTKDGILVVVGGFADDDEGQFNQKVANDVWVSMDGGYSCQALSSADPHSSPSLHLSAWQPLTVPLHLC